MGAPCNFFGSLIMFLLNKSVILEWNILTLNSSSLNMALILDPCGLLFSSLVLLISACVMMFSVSYMSHDPFVARFIWLVVLFVISMNLLIFIPNLMAILLGWDGLGLISFLLVIYYQNYKSLAAGVITVMMNRVGDVMILLSIAWSINQGHWNILYFWQTPLMSATVVAIMIAGMTKSAQIPFSSWLPAAMAAPTPVSALVHSSTLVTAGVFLLIRFYPFLSSHPWFNPTILLIATATMFMAGISAIYETDMKKIIALSTLSQLGVMMSAIGLDLLNLAMFHLFTHAMFKALLFLCAGNIIHQSNNNQDLRMMGGLSLQLPLSVTCLNIANLALVGTPFLAGFYSKDAILEFAALGSTNLLISIMLVLATLFTSTYSIRLSISSLWAESNSYNYHSLSDNDSLMTTPMIILTSGAVMAGAVISWFALPTNLEPIIPFYLKILALMVTLLGIWLAIYIFSLTSNVISGYKLLHTSSSTMWFLGLISAQTTIKAPLKAGHEMLKSMDHGWWEMFMGQGMFKYSKNLFSYAQPSQSSPLTLLMGLTFSFLGLAIIIMIM
uniref:NADH-ubiquinone oxidoreductase chain 5 n=1 Tax=Magelona mirabilis TaxID=46598 RepID=A0A0S2N0D7_9ANNE|nr:NADH dehydrogenase subunit 5 [Magelona mirabilis]ALO81683.1 NADH dehydrogenase subunit 5 [Magelona mirabilis]